MFLPIITVLVCIVISEFIDVINDLCKIGKLYLVDYIGLSFKRRILTAKEKVFFKNYIKFRYLWLWLYPLKLNKSKFNIINVFYFRKIFGFIYIIFVEKIKPYKYNIKKRRIRIDINLILVNLAKCFTTKIIYYNILYWAGKLKVSFLNKWHTPAEYTIIRQNNFNKKKLEKKEKKQQELLLKKQELEKHEARDKFKKELGKLKAEIFTYNKKKKKVDFKNTTPNDNKSFKDKIYYFIELTCNYFRTCILKLKSTNKFFKLCSILSPLIKKFIKDFVIMLIHIFIFIIIYLWFIVDDVKIKEILKIENIYTIKLLFDTIVFSIIVTIVFYNFFFKKNSFGYELVINNILKTKIVYILWFFFITISITTYQCAIDAPMSVSEQTKQSLTQPWVIGSIGISTIVIGYLLGKFFFFKDINTKKIKSEEFKLSEWSSEREFGQRIHSYMDSLKVGRPIDQWEVHYWNEAFKKCRIPDHILYPRIRVGGRRVIPRNILDEFPLVDLNVPMSTQEWNQLANALISMHDLRVQTGWEPWHYFTVFTHLPRQVQPLSVYNPDNIITALKIVLERDPDGNFLRRTVNLLQRTSWDYCYSTGDLERARELFNRDLDFMKKRGTILRRCRDELIQLHNEYNDLVARNINNPAFDFTLNYGRLARVHEMGYEHWLLAARLANLNTLITAHLEPLTVNYPIFFLTNINIV